MQNRLLTLLLGTALAISLAACGSGSTTSTSDSTPAVAAATTVQVVSDPSTIGAYAPASATARVGDTVAWMFVDQNPHSITADDASFDSTPKSAGATFTHKFDHPGTYAYHCSVHPEMHGNVVVN